MNKLIGTEYKVLDDGFVRVVDSMGDDSAVVQAARISYGAGTKKIHEDRGLIRYLMRHRHTTPFEMCEIKLHIRVPMDCWRQWIRHRTASVNEYSTRYSEAIRQAQKTKSSEWRSQSETNKQASGRSILRSTGEQLSSDEAHLQEISLTTYNKRLDSGVAREQARKDLPLSTYTEAYWKIDLHNLFLFLSLRMDEHAQLEIRQYANIIGEKIVASWCPLSWEAFRDYTLESTRLSRLELEILAEINKGRSDSAINLASKFGWLKRSKTGRLNDNRERREFEDKLERISIRAPWN